MALLYIPLRQDADQRATDQEVTLDGIRLRIAAYNASITDRWYITLLSTDDERIVGSIAGVPGVDLLIPYKHLALPQGQLFILNQQNREPGTFETQDVSALLVYREVGT